MSNNRAIQKAIMMTGAAALLLPAMAPGQNFGSPLSLTRKKIVLERKLPPTGHIEGTGIKVVVTGVGVAGDVGILPGDIGNAEFEAEFLLDGIDLTAHPRIWIEMHIGQILIVSEFLPFG